MGAVEIKNFPGYWVDAAGNIYSDKSRKTLSQSTCRAGYRRVWLMGPDGKRRVFGVHRLVAGAFNANPGSKPCVNHINGDKSNNHSVNLEWCTHKENMSHAQKSGFLTGPKSGKRNRERDKFIKALAFLGIPAKTIAEAVELCESRVRQIVKQ